MAARHRNTLGYDKRNYKLFCNLNVEKVHNEAEEEDEENEKYVEERLDIDIQDIALDFMDVLKHESRDMALPFFNKLTINQIYIFLSGYNRSFNID